VLFELRLDGPLPSPAFATLAEVMETIEELVASLGTPAVAKPPAGASPAQVDGDLGDAPQ
jgi:hypothetical protein